MKKIYNIAILAALSLLSVSCDSELEKINENHNATENPQPAYLLSAVEYHAAALKTSQLLIPVYRYPNYLKHFIHVALKVIFSVKFLKAENNKNLVAE